MVEEFLLSMPWVHPHHHIKLVVLTQSVIPLLRPLLEKFKVILNYKTDWRPPGIYGILSQKEKRENQERKQKWARFTVENKKTKRAL